MKLIICAIWDKKAQEYQTPFVMPNSATAIRNFMQAVKDEKSMLNQFAEDYRLDYLCEFHCGTGTFLNMEQKTLMEAANCVIKNTNEQK